MGIVYSAVDDRLHRSVALKVLRAEYSRDPTSRERFWREARLAARVTHPHICQLHDVGEDGGQLFLAMERLDGESLAARLRRGAMTVAEAVPTALDILAALDELHRHGIVHRDLKPSNVFLTANGAKLLDFGVAKSGWGPAAPTELALTRGGELIGTPRYMAPEQILGQAIGPSVDLFALGAILHEMLAGAPAFDGETIAAITHRIANADVVVLAGSPAIDAADRVIHRALAKSPGLRYANALSMVADLRGIGVSEDSGHAQYARPITRVIVLPFRLLRPDPDIEFVCFSLADAIATTLASLETLVVRSPLAAARHPSSAPDLAAIAKDADADVVLAGTVLRMGEVVRVGTQLLEASTGKILSSHTCQRATNDLFETEDAIVREVVESMMRPLAGREHRSIRPDVPSNAKAYEFYLRANALSHDGATWTIARDLYLQAVQADPDYAPAWARLGRLYRLLAKYDPAHGDPRKSSRRDEQAALAESAFNRALALNPHLAIADGYYAQLDLDLGRAEEAMVRLLKRAAVRGTDPYLFAALVSACRYCGLLDASFSAADRARRLDPTVRTSVTHTFFMAGEYLQAAAEAEQQWQVGNLGGVALLAAGHPDARARMALDAERYGGSGVMLAYLQEDLARAAIDQVLTTFPDPEFHFYSALMLAHFGQFNRAFEVLAGAIDRGYFPLSTLQRHHWLDPVRDRDEFRAILQRAEHRHRDAARAFVAADGSRVLGVNVPEPAPLNFER